MKTLIKLSLMLVSVHIQAQEPDIYQQDWQSPKSIVAALYETISADPYQQRNWQRFKLLFADDCHFSMPNVSAGDHGIMAMDVQQMIDLTDQHYLASGFHEIELEQRLEIYGQLASVYSHFEVKNKASDTQALMRGLNHFQLLHDGRRWWIVSNVSTIEK